MGLVNIREIEGLSPIFRGKMGNSLARALVRFVEIDKIERLYDKCSGWRGPGFTECLLAETGAEYKVAGMEVLGKLSGPFIAVCNHPYGGMDGIILVDILARMFPDFKVMVNGVLARLRALEDNFITVTPKGDGENTPTQESILGMKRSLSHLQDGHPLGIFPAGAVSDLSLKDRCVRDRPWQEPVIRLIQKAGVPVVPIRFFDGNSLFYSLLGLIDWRVRLLRLPHEVLNKAGRIIRVGIGAPISAEQQSRFSDAECFSRFLRNAVYGMPLPEKFTDSREIHQKFLYEVDSKSCLK